jgi:prophage regulatory protein
MPGGFMESCLRTKEICRKTGVSRWTIKRMEEAGDFPKSIRLGRRAIGWMESEVTAWMAQRQRERDNREVAQ